MVGMINLVVCGREDSALEEELVFPTRLINVWINGIDQTVDVILREMHVIWQLYGFVWGEV